MSPPVPSKILTDDVSLLMVLIDSNPHFWSSIKPHFSFSKFLSHVLAFLNSILLLNQLNQVVVIATGINSCGYVFDSSSGSVSQRAESLLPKLEEFAENDESLSERDDDSGNGVGSSLLSGSLSMALCYIQRVFRSGPLHPQPRIICLHGSPDGPGQYVAIMNSIFSAQRSMVPIDSCVIGIQHSAFLQQTVFATDLHSRNFLQLPKPVGVDFRASCFCHKNTIDMGFICSVCLSIFCKHQKKCSTCGMLPNVCRSIFGQAQTRDPSASQQRK
ncbi:general transcription and DNA repair factor IIH subunit TFB4-like isoform X3 [Coffea arabica]|uniref:General transcription and DNA repair factor IIH subunit TFB4 n=1 Tax=Coffea arabica TaxID=13443 RepID=A0ABM4U941_COFAR